MASPPPVARSATPPARNPPTQTLFARGPGAGGIGTTDAINYCDSFHSWAVALDHPGTLARATPPQRGTRTATGTYQVPLRWRGGGLPSGWLESADLSTYSLVIPAQAGIGLGLLLVI